MRIIKRYANRKLYDTAAKEYITLSKIAEMIRSGEEVQVFDNVSGDDLTALTFSQIIMEQEKKKQGYIPHNVLSALIEAGDKPANILRERLESSLGFFRQVDDEIERRFQHLIQRGELAEESARNLLRKLQEQSEIKPDQLRTPSANPDDLDIERLLRTYQIPTGDEYQAIREQVEALEVKINQLSKESNQK